MDHEIESPFTREKVGALRVGETVSLSGRVVTGRDRLHRQLVVRGPAPVDLVDAAVFHCGPVALRRDGEWRITAAGPTTSARLDLYMPEIVERYGVRVIIGKGGMGPAMQDVCSRLGCVYLQAVGGAAAILAATVQRVLGVHLLQEFGPAEAMWELEVAGLEAVVTMDTHGGSLHREIAESSRQALAGLFSKGSGDLGVAASA